MLWDRAGRGCFRVGGGRGEEGAGSWTSSPWLLGVGSRGWGRMGEVAGDGDSVFVEDGLKHLASVLPVQELLGRWGRQIGGR